MKPIKAIKLQADHKNRQRYKSLLEYENVNLKSNDDIYKFYKSNIKKSQSILPTFRKTTANLIMTREQIKLLSEVIFN